jgi:hypothetical protein
MTAFGFFPIGVEPSHPDPGVGRPDRWLFRAISGAPVAYDPQGWPITFAPGRRLDQ